MAASTGAPTWPKRAGFSLWSHSSRNLPWSMGLREPRLFFHRPSGWSLEDARTSFDRGERQRPPSVSVAAGAHTLNDSWFIGGGQLGIWRGDRLRYFGFGGYGSFNLTLSGITPGEQDSSFGYTLQGWLVGQSLRWRIADTPWFLGAPWGLAELTAGFRTQERPDLHNFQRDSRNGSLGAVLTCHSRDNLFSPSRGISASLEGKRWDDAFLGDFDYWEGSFSGAS